MSRIIRSGSGSRDRKLLEKGIVIALRELAGQSALDDNTRDLLAYIAFSLITINETIEESVTAWEKRGYWIKADHYRMEWLWAGRFGVEMKTAIIDENWGKVTAILAEVSQKLSTVKISQGKRLGRPWLGAYQKLISPN